MPNVGVVNATPFYEERGQYFLPPSEYVSLAQWFPLFGKTALFKPRLLTSVVPDGWMSLPQTIDVVSLCSAEDSLTRRLAYSRAAAEKCLSGVDLLYARMPNYEGYEVFRVAKRMNIPLLLELHGDWVGAVKEEDNRGLMRYVTRWLRQILADRKIKEMAAYATAIVTIGPELRQKYAPQGTPTLVSTNHLLSKEAYSRREHFQLKDPPLILFVGDIQRRKGLHILFQSLKDLKKMGHGFQMILVGDGDLQKTLKRYSERNGFSGQVVFAGRIPHGHDLFSWYKKADVFVLPSVAAEGVPRVTHEAMAFGCPVIATDIGSVAWQFGEGGGLLIPAGSRSALNDALLRVLNDKELRRGLSERGFERSLEFSLEEQQGRLAKFIGSVL